MCQKIFFVICRMYSSLIAIGGDVGMLNDYVRLNCELMRSYFILSKGMKTIASINFNVSYFSSVLKHL